jgi:hypothetical protein
MEEANPAGPGAHLLCFNHLTRVRVMPWPDPLRRTIWGSRAVVWLAGWLAPRAQRREWRALTSERLWHWCHFLAEAGQLNREKKLELARYCWGLFFEAFWSRYQREGFLRRADQVRRAPATCLMVLALLLVVMIWGGGFIPFANRYFPSPSLIPSGCASSA